MKKVESILLTTHVDSQGERFPIVALENMVESVNLHHIPVGAEHDPRIPPFGRIASAELRKREDGEFEVVATMDLLEEGDEDYLSKSEKEIVFPRAHEEIVVSSDWTHRHDEDQADMRAIASLLNSEPGYDVKKAAEPISIITLAGAFVLGGVASGFLGKVGSDAWDLISHHLGNIFRRTKNRKGDQLFEFKAIVEHEGYSVEAKIIATNPSSEDIDFIITRGLGTLDKTLPTYLINSLDVRKLVFELKDGEVELSFAVRKDCMPVYPSHSTREILAQLREPGDSRDMPAQ